MINGNTVWRQTYYIKCSNNTPLSSFQRRLYRLKNDNDFQYRLVHYTGDSSVYSPRPHGNKKNEGGERDYRRTLPSVINQLKTDTVVGERAPSKVYFDMVTGKSSGPYQGVTNARNLNQVKMAAKHMKAKRRILHDQLYNSLQLAYQIDGFVHGITVFPDLAIVFGSTEIIQEVNKLLKVKSDEPVLLSYDTTFELGDFYLSILVAKHILFRGGKTVPVAFMIHDRKSQHLHDSFWRKIKSLMPNIVDGRHVLVVDREIAFQNAVSDVLPNLKLVLCWNHIKRDLIYKLKKSGAKSDDLTVYSRQLEQLLHAEDENEFEAMYSEFSEMWSLPVCDYLSEMKEALKTRACKWVLEEYEVYDPFSGITNNICESLNATIKRLMSWKEAPIDAMILSLYYLQGFFKYEILRGKCGLGQFNLKDIHKNCQVDRDIVEFPNDVITPTEIIDRVKGNIQEPIQQLTKDEATCQNQETPEENDQKSTSTTQRSLALSAIRDNKVHLHTSAKSFVVEGTKGDKYAVTLHPKESCQCGAL